jgi:uncharacterized membrane protein YfcA
LTLFLFLAAFFGGALNSVAGGGSFIALPALLAAGVPAVSATATNTLALWPASLASALAYRREVSAARSRVVALGGVSLAGGLLGGLLLLRTSDAGFLRLLPWLMLLAAATFTFAGKFSPPSLDAGRRGRLHEHPIWALALQFAIAIYGGYFGGGMGIMTLAALSMTGMTGIHEMNGVKSVLAVVISGVALAEFIALGAIVWSPGLVMVAGGIAGGYAGAATARRIDQRYVRLLVILIAWTITVYFFWRSYISG